MHSVLWKDSLTARVCDCFWWESQMIENRPWMLLMTMPSFVPHEFCGMQSAILHCCIKVTKAPIAAGWICRRQRWEVFGLRLWLFKHYHAKSVLRDKVVSSSPCGSKLSFLGWPAWPNPGSAPEWERSPKKSCRNGFLCCILCSSPLCFCAQWLEWLIRRQKRKRKLLGKECDFPIRLRFSLSLSRIVPETLSLFCFW